MSKPEKLTLIEGTFNEADAKDILLNIYSSKINFHKMKNFSSQEWYGINDEFADKRIKELTNEVEKIKAMLQIAEETNKKIQISSMISIEILE